jgi:carbamoyltransferase
VRYILGINGGFGGGYQDPCACLYADGKIVAAVEEERLNKIKLSTGIFPLYSITEVLSLGEITISDVYCVAVHGSSWPEKVETDIRNYFLHHFGNCPPVKRFHHHDAHAASSYYLSGFDEALVVTMDNSGDGISSQVMTGNGKELSLLKRWERPNSFGTFYSCMTQLAGFKRDSDEYKLMGLAPYGNKDGYELSSFLSYKGDGNYEVNTRFLYPIKALESFPNKQIPLYSEDLLKYLGISYPSVFKDSNTQKNLAAAAQKQLEDVICEWISFWIKETGKTNLCLAGGVAMNCVLNKKIAERCGVKKIFIPPFAGDQGISIGTAFLAGTEENMFPDNHSFNAYTGRKYTQREIEGLLKHNSVQYHVVKDHISLAAKWIAEGRVIGWFQGHSEIGARALGNRSILANPAIAGMKDKINSKIKFREGFRPFCPSVLQEYFDIYFTSVSEEIPFMNITADCKEITKLKLPEIVHIDGTARVQTVKKEDNKMYHELLSAVKTHTGHGMVLNTSLNVRNQPMAYDVNDALISFFTSGMDALFIENIAIEKQ